MKVFAIHDSTGAILEVVTTPDNAPAAGIIIRAGWTMTEINMPDDIHIVDSVEGNEQELTNLVQQYRVIVNSRIARLERLDHSAP